MTPNADTGRDIRISYVISFRDGHAVWVHPIWPTWLVADIENYPTWIRKIDMAVAQAVFKHLSPNEQFGGPSTNDRYMTNI